MIRGSSITTLYWAPIPTLLETMGIDPAQAPPWEDFRLNVTGSALLNRLRRSALLKSLRHPLSRRRDNEERSSS